MAVLPSGTLVFNRQQLQQVPDGSGGCIAAGERNRQKRQYFPDAVGNADPDAEYSGIGREAELNFGDFLT